MKHGYIADIHLATSDNLSPIDGATGLSIRTLDKLKALDKAISISIEEGCEHFFLIGDIFDKLNPPDRLKKAFYETMKPYFYRIGLWIVVGNHDGADFTNNYLSEQLLMEEVENPPIHIIDKITTLSLGAKGEEVLVIPWTIDEVAVETAIIAANKNILCLAHLEISGAVASTEYVLTGGFPAGTFDKFRHTFMGHYHRYQTIKKVTYVGSPIIKDFSELGVQKGFMIYDYQSNKKEFISLEERKAYVITINEENAEEIESWLEQEQIKPGSLIKILLEGSTLWVRQSRPVVYEVFHALNPLKLVIDKKILKQNVENATQEAILNSTNRIDRLKEFAKDVDKTWVDYGLKIYNHAENKYMEA